MVVGVMEVTLALYDTGSLKAKRSVVRRVINRVRQRFNVSAAEVDDQNALNRAVLGFVATGSDARYVEGLLSKVENAIDAMGLAELLDAPKTIEHF